MMVVMDVDTRMSTTRGTKFGFTLQLPKTQVFQRITAVHLVAEREQGPQRVVVGFNDVIVPAEQGGVGFQGKPEGSKFPFEVGLLALSFAETLATTVDDLFFTIDNFHNCVADGGVGR